MQKIVLDAEAGQVSAELARRGIAAETRVYVVVEISSAADPLPMVAIAQAGGGFNWLAEEPDLYTDTNLVPQTG